MSVDKVRAYLKTYGVDQRIQEFEVSSATVELAAQAAEVEPARSCSPALRPAPSASRRIYAGRY